MISLMSFTGADDMTYLPDLFNVALKAAERQVVVEAALLIFPEKQGKQRNPSFATRHAIRNSQMTAAHLCGKVIFDALLNKDKSPVSYVLSPLLEELRHYQRIQVNINAREDQFTEEQVHAVWLELLQHCPSSKIILQYHERTAATVVNFINKMKNNEFPAQQNLANMLFGALKEWEQRIQILVDGSQGKGKSPDSWKVPDLELLKAFPIGIAGGFTPDNIYSEVQRFMADNDGFKPNWTDVETGIRENNMLSIRHIENFIHNLCEWTHE